MDKNASVDREVSIRRLDEKSFGLRMIYARSDDDVNRGVSIGISFVSTSWTLEVRSTPNAYASAPRTDGRCPSCVDCNQKPTVLPSHRFECHSKLMVRHFLGFSAAFSIASSVLQPVKVFHGYESVAVFSEFNDFMCDLPATCSDVVALISPEPSESLPFISAAVVSVASQFASSKADVSLTVSHILTKVKLLHDFARSSQSIQRAASPHGFILAPDR